MRWTVLIIVIPLSGCFHYNSCYVDPWTAYCVVSLKPNEAVVPGVGYIPALLGPNSSLGAAAIGARLAK
jgi:hypothetical protein